MGLYNTFDATTLSICGIDNVREVKRKVNKITCPFSESGRTEEPRITNSERKDSQKTKVLFKVLKRLENTKEKNS